VKYKLALFMAHVCDFCSSVMLDLNYSQSIFIDCKCSTSVKRQLPTKALAISQVARYSHTHST